MSLKNTTPPFLGNALIGACCALLISIPLAAYIASLMGDTYLIRVWIYGAFLLWVVTGAITIFFRTYKAEKNSISLRFIVLWFFSIWLWPLLLLVGKKRE